MRERVPGTLRRIYGPPYRGLGSFLLVLLVLTLLGQSALVIKVATDVLELAVEWEFRSPLTKWIEGLSKLVDRPLMVLHRMGVILVQPFGGCPLLLPGALIVGLTVVWRGRGSALRIWGMVFSVAGAYGIGWCAIAVGGGDPGILPPFVEPALWAGGSALAMLVLLPLARPGPVFPLPMRRLPALTVLALVAAHTWIVGSGPVGTALSLLDRSAFDTYINRLLDFGDRPEMLAFTMGGIALPVLLLFTAVAIRGCSIREAFLSIVGTARRRPVSMLVAVIALLLLGILTATAQTAGLWVYVFHARSVAAAYAIAYGILIVQTLFDGAFLYFAVRTVWFVTETPPDWHSVRTG